ncbi:Hypothetical predicted protein, partial [Pelobates cultripes]
LVEPKTIVPQTTYNRQRRWGPDIQPPTHQKEPERSSIGNPPIEEPPLEASSNAMLHSLAEVKGYLAEEIKHTAAEVKAEITARGARTVILEQRMEHVVTAHNSAMALTNSLLHRITDLELELEDVSNRS